MTAADRRFEPLGGRTVYEGRIVTLRIERYRYPDGEEVEREVIRHQGAVGIVAHDGTDLFLVRQPREVIGDPDFLEIPAGRLDVEGEAPLEAAQRELAEEIGKAAEHWEHITDYVSSVGVMDEVVHLYLATGLSDEQRRGRAQRAHRDRPLAPGRPRRRHRRHPRREDAHRAAVAEDARRVGSAR